MKLKKGYESRYQWVGPTYISKEKCASLRNVKIWMGHPELESDKELRNEWDGGSNKQYVASWDK